MFLFLFFSIITFLIIENEQLVMNSILIIVLTFSTGFVTKLIFVFGGYYFANLFFNTKLSVKEFYTIFIYLHIPIAIGYILLNLIVNWLNYTSFIYTGYLTGLMYIVFIYYGFKALNTSLGFFQKQFNTTGWSMVGVTFLWMIILSGLLNFFSFFISFI